MEEERWACGRFKEFEHRRDPNGGNRTKRGSVSIEQNEDPLLSLSTFALPIPSTHRFLRLLVGPHRKKHIHHFQMASCCSLKKRRVSILRQRALSERLDSLHSSACAPFHFLDPRYRTPRDPQRCNTGKMQAYSEASLATDVAGSNVASEILS